MSGSPRASICSAKAWAATFQHYEAVYLLVDTRDLTVVDNVEPSLAHWPAVAAWWSSRLRYVGPRDEQVDLVFVRASIGALGYTLFIQHGLARLSLRHWSFSSPRRTSSS